MHRSRSRCLLAAWLLISIFPLNAEVRPPAPLRVPVDLRQLTPPAGMIFSGKVKSVTPERPTGSDQVTSVAITFWVEQAIRGTRVGRQLTIHEWAGLWAAGEGYRVGERLMLFLHAPSQLGLTRPVGGAAGGRFPPAYRRVEPQTRRWWYESPAIRGVTPPLTGGSFGWVRLAPDFAQDDGAEGSLPEGMRLRCGEPSLYQAFIPSLPFTSLSTGRPSR